MTTPYQGLSGTRLRPFLAVPLLLIAAACAAPLPDTGISDPTPWRFAYCHNHTCETIETLSLAPEEWAAVTHPMQLPAANAAEERGHIAATVAAFERAVAPKVGTDEDIGGTIKGVFRLGQLDCVDEAQNTTALMAMLGREGLLRWHDAGAPAMRLVILSDGAPHYAATVIEKASGTPYAVDSWFRDNGAPADVVLLAEWEDGWNPPDE